MTVAYKTTDEIKASTLSNISNEYEKSEGNITHDIPASISIELNKLYDNIQTLYNSIDVDKLEDDELTKFTKQRKGINRKIATYSKGTLNVIGSGTINQGDLFETVSGLQFKSLETKLITTTGTIDIECVTPGSIGNVGSNSIIYIPITITGIISVVNIDPTIDGFEEENDISLRSRYYEALQTPPTSGNIYHYYKWSKEVLGVGRSKVISLWNGDNTVKVIIINSDMLPASSEIVSNVQEYIDPGSNGRGEGQAPIGAYCNVISAAGLNIDIDVDVTEEDGYTLQEVKENIEIAIATYLKEIAFVQNYVSYAKIGSLIFDAEGVKDYTTLLVNSGAVNIDILNEEVAVVGTVTIS